MRCYCMGNWCAIMFSGLVHGTDEVLLHGELMWYHIFWISIWNRWSVIAWGTDVISYFLGKYIEQMKCYCMGNWCDIIFSGLVYWTDQVILHGELMWYHIFWISILNRSSDIALLTDVLSYFLDKYIEQMRCYCMGYWCAIIFSG